VIGEGMLAIYLLVFAARVIANPEMNVRGWLVGAIALAIIPPALFFPMSRTTWMAVDLQMHPLEPYEVAEADLYRAATEGCDPS